MRRTIVVKNAMSSILFQIAAIMSNFFLPRLFISQYGSEVNGLVDSITQFLQFISFMELGVGAVVQYAFYKPLADNDEESISRIIASASKFFSRISYVLLGYVLTLIIFFPYISNQRFEHIYSATLIAVMSISFFAQYYFGIVDRLLLIADQKGYINYNVQTVTLVLNTILCFVLIRNGTSIHLVKLITSLIYAARPLITRWYVNNHYEINRKIKYIGEPIKQKWNGVAQHVAAVVLDGTDQIVLTIFTGFSAVSVYSVYNMVAYGIKQLFLAMTNSIRPLLGELWAKQELDELKNIFGLVEWIIHTGAIYVFGCTGVLIVPFVQVYTKGISDADYYQPLFAVLLTTAQAGHCLRLPYNHMILAAGHFKETQSNYIIAATLNIIISVITVSQWGLIGVAIGTLAAMVYQTVWMAVYNSKNILEWPFTNFIKQMMVDFLTVFAGGAVTKIFCLGSLSYLAWVALAMKVAILWLILTFFINMIFYREKIFTVQRVLAKNR